MKKFWDKWTEIALVKRILVGLILGAILGIAVPQATGIAILGDVFVSALKAIAPLLVFFLVISSLCNAVCVSMFHPHNNVNFRIHHIIFWLITLQYNLHNVSKSC